MAVDDASAMPVRIAAGNATLSGRFTVRPGRIEVVTEVEVDDVADSLPTRSFTWRLLESSWTKVSAVHLCAEPGQHGSMCVTLTTYALPVHRP